MAALVARNAVAEPAAHTGHHRPCLATVRHVLALPCHDPSEHGDVDETILVVNAGPSIIKFAAWPAGDP